MQDNETTVALNAIITALTPLKSDERRRVVGAAMMFLGEKPVEQDERHGGSGGGGDQVHSSTIQKWMKQNGVSETEMEQVFQFGENGTFDLLDAPGKTKKERMLNTYILTGLAKYLVTGYRNFDDATAREYCERFGCYDQANFAAHMREKGPEFAGDKAKGYTLTNVGIKRGATIIKELAAGSK